MKVKTINCYMFDEFNEEDKLKLLSKYRYINITVDHGWWNDIYEGASNIGVEIKGFDLNRNTSHVNIIISNYKETAILISKNWSDSRLEIAKRFLAHKNKKDFHAALCEHFINLLKEEYDYLISDKKIIKTLIENKYYFNEKFEIEIV